MLIPPLTRTLAKNSVSGNRVSGNRVSGGPPVQGHNLFCTGKLSYEGTYVRALNRRSWL